ncbi:hypothetical protein ACJJTC_005285 [Scirpophaga incertulas]
MDPNLEAKERRLETPEGRRSSRTTVRAVSLRSRRGNRSRSRLRDSNNLRDRERDIERERDRLRMMERDLRAERDRLRDRDRSSARGDWDRSSARGDQDRSSARDRSPRPRTREVSNDRHCQSNGGGENISRSSLFSCNDVMTLLKTIKNLAPQPSSTAGRNYDFKNILPEFDPSVKSQRVDTWLKKVNECASVYGWDDKTIIHFAMQKLQGNCNKRSEAGKADNVLKTMCISTTSPNSKFLKDALINNMLFQVFIDFGSEVSLIKHSVATSLGLRYDANTSALKGFGNCIVQTLGGVIVDVIIDDVAATVSCQVVDDKNLDTPLLIGQSYTEQKHMVVYKDSNTLTFYNFSKELPFCREDHNFNTSVTILCFSGLMLYGLASIKLGSDFVSNGPIMIGTKVNGVPNHQYIVYGGVHQMTNGTTYVTVQPLVIPCRLREGIVARGTKINVINKIVKPVITNMPLDIEDSIDSHLDYEMH